MECSAQLTAILRQHGLRLTPQRLSVARVLADDSQGHLTAEAVFTRVRQTLPTISLATVYKVLNEFVALGQVRRVELGEGSARFDTTTEGHAHLLCRGCGHIADLPASDYQVAWPVAPGYQILDHAVIFYGLCPVCRATADGSRASRPSRPPLPTQGRRAQ